MDDAEANRRIGTRILGSFGPHGKNAVPALSAAVDDKDEAVQKAAAAAWKPIQRKYSSSDYQATRSQ
jgi:hypothetical protein